MARSTRRTNVRKRTNRTTKRTIGRVRRTRASSRASSRSGAKTIRIVVESSAAQRTNPFTAAVTKAKVL